ncbi:hypothetical protein N7522_001076 [Penicillium canescens]|uniref:Uncharacterized protein n=1 Tax=Penicillium canescens TaxID=5083 RepID=A0AAD6N7G6_PENCN|nr:uncharacterized protein N7446_010333 [Penicillium canescens]KAJ6019009.1 hypothetical protein N7522_001076 [Penicillium canescens]KAJ6035572.1 hypothetical protein N7460_009747 [Penicillium canescens]KAJ6054321.1 hypothetical protein N7446_010333 [Penicillium canescens]
MQNNVPVGTQAVEGQEYVIRGAILFQEAPYDREVTGNGDSIMVYDPNADMSSPPYWENGDDPSKEETSLVPARHKVRVIAAVAIAAVVKFRRV